MKIRCKLCWEEFDEKDVEEHHIIPKCIGGTDKDGRAYLCKKCHTIWHFELVKHVWEFVPEEIKGDCKLKIRVIFRERSENNARKKNVMQEYEKYWNWDLKIRQSPNKNHEPTENFINTNRYIDK